MRAAHTYVHALDGRLRVKVPSVKGSGERARQVEELLRGSEAIQEVSANPRTGNVLILYDSRLTNHDRILVALHRAGYFDRRTKAAHREPHVVQRIAASVLQATLERALHRLIVSLA